MWPTPALEVTGEHATDWLSKAQAFAGPPTDGPRARAARERSEGEREASRARAARERSEQEREASRAQAARERSEQEREARNRSES